MRHSGIRHSKLKTYAQNLSWSILGIALMGFAPSVILVVISRLGTEEALGQYSIALALVTPVMAATMMQLRGLQSTDAKNHFHFRDYLTLRLVSNTVAIVIVSIVAVITRQTAVGFVLVLLITFSQVGKATSDIYTGFFQLNERHDLLSQTRILLAISMVAGFVIGMGLSGNVIVGALLSGIAAHVPLMIHSIPNYRRLVASEEDSTFPVTFDKQRQTKLFFQALPLAIVALMIALSVNLPYYLLALFSSVEEIGRFAALAVILTVTSTMGAPVSQILAPQFARLFATNEKQKFVRLLVLSELSIALLWAIGMVVVFLFGSQVMSAVYATDFSSNRNTIVWLAVAGGLRLCASFVGITITVGRVLYPQIVTNALDILVLAITGLILIPDFGITGAAIATAVASLNHLVANSYLLIQFLRSWHTPKSTDLLNAEGGTV